MKNKNYISPREVLSNKFLKVLAANGIKSDEAIIAYLIEQEKQNDKQNIERDEL
jgi:hypothetical protein